MAADRIDAHAHYLPKGDRTALAEADLNCGPTASPHCPTGTPTAPSPR